MKFIQELFTKIRLLIYNLRSAKQEKQCRKKYPDYNGETAYDCGDYKFIWGVKSSIDLCSEPACLHTMNDIDLIYSREKKRYILSIETALWFDKKEDEIAYLISLLDAFTKYMRANNLPTDEPYKFWMSQPSILLEGETIPEVYTNFKIFVEGYKTVHKPTIVNTNPKIQLL